MRALVLERGALALRDVPAPRRAGECLVRVRLAGICGTDLELVDGYADFRGTPGHEFVGVVEGPSRSWLGRRVVGEINIGCGACRWCRDGVKEHCAARAVLGIRGRDGAFAEYVSVPAANLHVVPDGVPDDAAVFTEPLAAACRIGEQIDLRRTHSAAVLGDGRLGLLVAQVLALAGSRVTVVGRHEPKLAVARALGLEAVTSDAAAAGAAFDIVVEVTGRPSGLEAALGLVRPRGTIVLKSTFHGAAPMPTWPIVVNEVTMIGSRCGPFSRALDLLARGAIQVKPLVTGVYGLEKHEAAFEAARGGLKVLLRPGV
jgi:alcohol dehydrogenase